jgi:hypothetical protein
MKRLPITFEERQFFKAIEKTAVVLLIMFRIYPIPVNIENLAYEMKWDARTAEKYLESLASDNLTLLVKGQGYILTGETRRLIAQFFGTILSMPLEAPALAQESQAQALNSEALESVNNSESQLDPLAERLNAGSEDTHTVCALEEVEESLSLKDSESSTSKSAQNVLEWPAVEKILGATPILFGDPGVITRGLHLENITPLIALGWIAHAWDQWPQGGRHGDLRSPAGLVYKNLADPDKPRPRAKYYDGGWKRVLPESFLEVLGLAEITCDQCSEIFMKRELLNSHVESEHPAPEPNIEIASPNPAEIITRRFDGHMSAEQAWQTVQDQLRMEMPRSSFETWVRDTQAIHYENSILMIAAANAYARDWLESRLTSTIERLLIGILNSKVAVSFVIAELPNAEENE